jgi:hypothetical protein
MTIQEPEHVNPDHAAVDSGIHVRDSEAAPANGWQITMVGILIVAILCVFFYGLTSQRQEVAGPSAPAQQATNVPSSQTQKTPSTTGQGAKETPNPKNPPGATRQQQPQKASGQNATQPPSAPQKNQ